MKTIIIGVINILLHKIALLEYRLNNTILVLFRQDSTNFKSI